MPNYSLDFIAKHIGAELKGNCEQIVDGLNTIQDASSRDITFLANASYKRFLSITDAAAIIVDKMDLSNYSGNLLIVDNPYLAYALVSELFASGSKLILGIHKTAVISAGVKVPKTATIGANVVLGKNVIIGEKSIIGPNSSIGDGSIIGDNCKIFSNVSICHGVTIGNRVTIQSCSVIGGDGFGFAHDSRHWVKIHQLGGVIIGNRVEIGSCTTIDRGALGDTVIEDGVILDNHIQIAHNVHIGENTAIAG